MPVRTTGSIYGITGTIRWLTDARRYARKADTLSQ
jgi:hypothetical protein